MFKSNYLTEFESTKILSEIKQQIELIECNKLVFDEQRLDGFIEYKNHQIAFEIIKDESKYILSVNCSKKNKISFINLKSKVDQFAQNLK